MERESGRSTRRSLPVVPNRNVSQLGHLVSHHDLDLYYIRQIAGHLKVFYPLFLLLLFLLFLPFLLLSPSGPPFWPL